MKTCVSCKEEKPIEEFQKRASTKDGYAGTCKVCKRAYDNAHYKAHPQRRLDIRASDTKRRDVNREWVRTYFETHPCVDCGESDIVVLQFDHQSGKVASVCDMIRSNSLEKLVLEVSKCLVRCANCHTRKTAKDFGWWKNASFA